MYTEVHQLSNYLDGKPNVLFKELLSN